MTEKMIDDDILCNGQELGFVLIPGSWDIDESILLCRQIGGENAVIKSSSDQTKLSNMFRASKSCTAKSKNICTFMPVLSRVLIDFA